MPHTARESTAEQPADAPRRASYRHGDLRAALVAEGLELAASGGPDAVVLRETTRRAGVAPNAAYRHFADRQELLMAVSAAAQGRCADYIEDEFSALTLPLNSIDGSRAALSAVGRGYLRFAREEPGLFRTAFTVPDDLQNSADSAKAGRLGNTPFQLLGNAIEAMAASGAIPPERRMGAELLAWSAVHGLGMLAIDGPLRGLSPEMIDGTTTRLLAMVERGI